MRRAAPFLAILFAVLVPALAVVAAESDAKKPQAVPTEPVKDFEVVAKGEAILHEFEIRNEGQAPLELTDVRPACGCTVASYDREIAPGAAGKVRIRLTTDNFTGPIAKSIAVYTNDTDNPKLQLVVKAKVTPYIGVHPGFARFNYVQGEPVGEIVQLVWAEDGNDFDVVSVKPPYDNLKVTYREATEDEANPKGHGKQYRFVLELDPYSPVGALRDYVEIQVDHPKQQLIRLPISGFVRPRQHVTPHEVDFGPLDGSALPLQRTFAFTNFITDKIELKQVETGYPAVTAEVRDGSYDVGHRFKLLLTIGPDMPKGEFESTVKIHTTDEQNPVVELPIKGEIL